MIAHPSTGLRKAVFAAVLLLISAAAHPVAALPQASASGPAGGPSGVSKFMGSATAVRGTVGVAARSAGIAAGATGAAARAASVFSTGFRLRQLEFPRVRSAYESSAARVAADFRAAGIEGPADVMFRVFKREQVLEVWARARDAARYVLVRSYPVCDVSGRLGPKRRQGDRQIPEGFYEIDLFNPWSQYHLSMRVNYPNAVDRSRGARGPLGGDIYVHGGCATIGCVPMTDSGIEEIYVIAVEARESGQRKIPIHIFPTRLDDAGMRWLGRTYGRNFVDYPFWQNLKSGYDLFERRRMLPQIGTAGARYTFAPEPVPALATAPAPVRTVGAPLPTVRGPVRSGPAGDR